jgi:hypothetical protein
MSGRMTAVDAQFYRMSAKIPSDQFCSAHSTASQRSTNSRLSAMGATLNHDR